MRNDKQDGRKKNRKRENVMKAEEIAGNEEMRKRKEVRGDRDVIDRWRGGKKHEYASVYAFIQSVYVSSPKAFCSSG